MDTKLLLYSRVKASKTRHRKNAFSSYFDLQYMDYIITSTLPAHLNYASTEYVIYNLVYITAGRSNAMLAVSQAVQDTARLHQAAKLAAAVPFPPAPATTTPGLPGNIGRANVADLFTATPPVFATNGTGDHSQSPAARRASASSDVIKEGTSALLFVIVHPHMSKSLVRSA